MIIYDLRCEKGHEFEGWFNDRSAFEKQQNQKLVICPTCGSSEVGIMLSTISIMGKDVKASNKSGLEELSLPKALKLFHEYLDKNFDDVGKKFTEVALRIHHGEEEGRNIRGITTENEEEILKEEGVQFVKIPVPKFDS
ncbi:MAG TPA: DUF1178 family protein [Syntrophales bacterium]|nr:DUF1178 family protein [Syntrophales bacterium]